MMFSGKELKLVYGVTACLLVLSVVSYAAFPVNPPKRPLRVGFQNVAGKVMFDHGQHLAASGYGLACGECHHTLAADESEQAGSCTECHPVDDGDDQMPKRSDAIHQQCIGCHQEYGAGPVDCAQCHVMQ